MKKDMVFLELEDLHEFAENSLFISDIWEIEFLIETGLETLDHEDLMKTIIFFLLRSKDSEAIANLLLHFGPKELPTALLEYLFQRVEKPSYGFMDQIGRLCSMDKRHPHYLRFVTLLKEVILWKHSKHYLYLRDRETWKLNHFDTILELVIDHGINIWNFGYLFSEEELGILRLMATEAGTVQALSLKADRLTYRLEDHSYSENLKSLMKMRKSELLYLCRKYALKGYSKLRAIQIIHLLLKSVPSKKTEEKPKTWTTYWIEDHDFISNLNNFKKMKLGLIRAIGYKYGISGAFYMDKKRLVRELLRIGCSKDKIEKNQTWQNYWLEEYYPEVNLLNLQEMRKTDLIKLGYKYGLKRISRLRKDEIINQILKCDPRMVSISIPNPSENSNP